VTDRHAGYIVTLPEDQREDDADATLQAIRMIRGVVSVEPVVADAALHVAEHRAWYALRGDVVRAVLGVFDSRDGKRSP
jgi:hypothetical protein